MRVTAEEVIDGHALAETDMVAIQICPLRVESAGNQGSEQHHGDVAQNPAGSRIVSWGIQFRPTSDHRKG